MAIKLNKWLDEMVQHEMLRLTPEWPDICHHGEENYLFSFFDRPAGMRPQWFDVHIYQECNMQEFCIRYGKEGSNYLSPGGIKNLLCAGSHYERVVRILELAGRIEWIANK